jgi:hypothetical protein
MTNEERDLIASFVARVGGTPAAGAPVAGQGAMAPLPPVDREADALIADLFNRYPEARYRVTQMAFLQEHALVEAQNRINRLQWELQQVKQAQAAPPADQGSPWGNAGAAQPGPSRGIFGGLFGGGSRPAAPPPQYAAAPPQYAPQYAAPPPPMYPPGYNPGLFPQQGTGFFGGALRTAAGVAGGVLAADALMSLFSPHQGFGGGFGGGGFGGGFGGSGVVENTTVINEPGSGANPWGTGADPMDAGGAPKDFDQGVNPPATDQSAWSPAPDQGAGWQQADAGGGGWQDAPAQPDQGGGWEDASNAGDGGWSDSGDSGGGGDSSSDS